MAVAHENGQAVSFSGISNPEIPALTHAGSNNAVGVQILWNDIDSRTLSSVKYGGSSGTDMTAVSNATIDQTGGGSSQNIAPNCKGRGYQLVTGSSGDNKVYIVFSGNCTGTAHSQAMSGVDTGAPIHTSSGFSVGATADFALGNVARTFNLNSGAIPTDTDEVVVYAGMMSCSSSSTVTTINSSTGTESSSTSPLNTRTEGKAFYDTSDSNQEFATIQLVAPQYYYTASFQWYQPGGTAIMVGWAWNAATGGGPTNVALTGSAISSAQGSLGKAFSIGISGAEIISEIGNVSAFRFAALTGQEITSEIGSIGKTLDIVLSGIELTSAIGELSVQTGDSVPITGNEIASAQGSLGVSINIPLVGSTITVSQGNLAIAGSTTLTNPSAINILYNGWTATVDVNI